MEEKKYGKCPHCNAPCEAVTKTSTMNLDGDIVSVPYDEYNYCQQPGPVWVKATPENMRRSAILRDSVLPENHIHQWAIRGWDEKGVRFDNKVEKEWWELEILVDESGESKEGNREIDAVAFNIYCTDSYYYENGYWWHKEGHDPYSVDQLYAIFKQQKEK